MSRLGVFAPVNKFRWNQNPHLSSDFQTPVAFVSSPTTTTIGESAFAQKLAPIGDTDRGLEN